MRAQRLRGHTRAAPLLWTATLAAAAILFSLRFACATPFAALATVAALNLRARDALLMVMATWLTNQLVGFGLLHYPHRLDTLAWGAAIGMAAVAACGAAMACRRLVRQPLVAAGASLPAAYATYELLLYAATWLLPSGGGAFSLAVVAHILLINAVAYAGLLVLQGAAARVGLPAPKLPASAVPGHS